MRFSGDMKKFRIRNFQDFITENYEASSLADVFQRFYMLVRKPFPTDSENELGQMIGSVRNSLFDQISVDSSNYKMLPIQPGIPVLNFTEDNDLVQAMINQKVIDEASLYNHPLHSSIVSNKVSFHQTFSGVEFVPKTVFSVEETKELDFPIIAKPANGKSAEGIKKFESFEELKETSERFDVFSEMIDIKNEFRCFCFKDTVLELNQRIKIKGSEDFLKDSKTKTDFYYKDIDPSKYKYRQEMNEILGVCREIAKLDFFSVDFAETSDGKLFVIEMNSRTGMGVDKMVDLYTHIYEDFYKNPPSDTSLEKMKALVDAWDKAYEQNKGSNINECTTVAGKLDGVTFLFKNRDRSFTPNSEVIHERIDGVEVAYYTDQTSWVEGMNEHGVGFVFSQLTGKHRPGYGPSWYVSDDPKDDSKFQRFEKGVKKILTAKNANEAVKLLLASKKSGSFLIGDSNDVYEFEVFNGKHKKRKLEFNDSPFYTKTNHGELIPDAGHQPSGDSIKRGISEIRRHQANMQLMGIQDITEIPERMKFQAYDPSSPLNVFRTDPEEYTISQCMMDLTNLQFFFFHDSATADTMEIVDKIKDGKIKIDSRKI